MQILDCSPRDFIGAAVQWKSYITTQLGFDDQVKVAVELGEEQGLVQLQAFDRFQRGVNYSEWVGQLGFANEPFKIDEDWAEVQARVWVRLEKAMRRDERELRFGIQQLGGMLEGFSTETAVGRLICDRLRAVRDEMSGNLLTYQLGEGRVE